MRKIASSQPRATEGRRLGGIHPSATMRITRSTSRRTKISQFGHAWSIAKNGQIPKLLMVCPFSPALVRHRLGSSLHVEDFIAFHRILPGLAHTHRHAL